MRLFVALALPAAGQAALAAWVRAAAADAAAPPGMRRLPPANLHMTLAFLGSRPDADAAAIADVVRAVARPVGELSVDRALWLPPKRPGVLSVALRAGPALNELHGELVAALADAIGFEPERRP